jgi:hypothetical protein
LAPAAAAWTIRQAVTRIVQLGLTGPDAAVPDGADRPLAEAYESLTDALVDLLEVVGIGFQVGTDDDVTPGYEADAYGGLLEEAARCTGGLVTITDVELGDDEELRFRCNGTPHTWPIELRGEYVDLMSFSDGIDDLDVPPRVWDSIDVDESDGCDPDDLELRNFYFFGDPTALRELAADFDLRLLRHDLP